MGRTAQSVWILRLFAAVLFATAAVHAHAAAFAEGVALSASAGCTAGDLAITLTTSGASSESWFATNLAGTTLVQGGGGTSLMNISATFDSFKVGPIGFVVSQPPNTLIGSYAWVGAAQPTASNTAEFFVYYNCGNPPQVAPQVLLRCFGPYGTCPQTAPQAAAQLARGVPALGKWALPLTLMLVAAAGGLALRRRRA
jgi:hypothetical protein